MKRSPQPQGRTTLKSQPPFEPHSWPSCLVGREISCQCWLPTTAAYRAAPRKRSHSRSSTMNRSFQLYSFPGGKRSTSLWVCVRDTQAAGQRRGSGTAFLWSASLLKALLLWGGGKADTCRPAWRSHTWLRLPCEAVCSLFSLCTKLMEFAVD